MCILCFPILLMRLYRSAAALVMLSESRYGLGQVSDLETPPTNLEFYGRTTCPGTRILECSCHFTRYSRSSTGDVQMPRRSLKYDSTRSIHKYAETCNPLENPQKTLCHDSSQRAKPSTIINHSRILSACDQHRSFAPKSCAFKSKTPIAAAR